MKEKQGMRQEIRGMNFICMQVDWKGLLLIKAPLLSLLFSSYI